MRLKQSTLFMKRSIYINRRMHKDFAFTQNRNVRFGDIRVVSDSNFEPDKEVSVEELTRNISYDGPADEYDEENFHYQLKPLMLMLRVLGIFPVEISKSG